MNNWTYGLIGGVIGLVVGGAAVYFWEEHRLEDERKELYSARHEYIVQQHNDKTQDEGLKDELEEEKYKVEQLLDSINVFCNENDKANIVDLVNTRLTVRKMTKEGFSTDEITDRMVRGKAEKIVNLCGYRNDGREFTEYFTELESAPSKEARPPYLISEDEYTRWDPEADGYEHEVLRYFALDDTLADEDDDIVEHSIVGRENLNAFSGTDLPSVFVRNERLDIEYEILWEEASYQAEILGLSTLEACGKQYVFRKGKEDDE